MIGEQQATTPARYSLRRFERGAVLRSLQSARLAAFPLIGRNLFEQGVGAIEQSHLGGTVLFEGERAGHVVEKVCQFGDESGIEDKVCAVSARRRQSGDMGKTIGHKTQVELL